MLMKICIGIGVLVLGFLGYVASRPAHFRYERSGVINAPPEKIFPYLTDFHKAGEWSPYEKMDPGMKKTYGGTEGSPGATMTFESKNGSGSLELLKTEPNKSVEIMLRMTAPIKADNQVTYTLTPEAGGTRFSWAMEGDNGFLGKLMTTVIDCEKMMAGQFTDGINNLKILVESKQAGSF